MNNNEFAKRLSVWLSAYTDKVIEKVMQNIESIRNNETTLQLLENLYQATLAKDHDSEQTFSIMLDCIDSDRYNYINIHDRYAKIRI